MLLFRRLFVTVCFIVSVFLCDSAFSQEQKVWTVAVIPDTQYYVRNADDAEVFTEITQWLVDHKHEINLQLVLHVGDIVDRNKTEQWDRAKESIKVLDGELPYVLSVGNHDLGKNASDRTTMLNQYCKISDNPLNEKIFGGYYQEGHLENAWYNFKYGDKDYLIFSLEFGPRDEVVQWASKIASQHHDKKIILVTHEYVDQESTLFTDDSSALHTTHDTKNSPYSYGVSKLDPVNCGQELWEAFVSKFSNFEFVFNGHYKAYKKTGPNPENVDAIWDALAAGYRSDTYQDGNVVHQMLFNAQWAKRGGEGWIRLLEFYPDGTVKVKTFSPYVARISDNPQDAWKTDKNMQFQVKLSPQN